MKFGWNFVTGINTYLSSWKTNEDPAPGDYAYFMDTTGYPQIFMTKNKVERIRIGPWNGLRFSGTTNAIEDPTYKLMLVMNENEVNYREETIDRSVISRFTLSQSGLAQRWTWVDRTQEWVIYLNVPADNCDNYKLCGAYGTCNIAKSPSCECLDKFSQRSRKLGQSRLVEWMHPKDKLELSRRCIFEVFWNQVARCKTYPAQREPDTRRMQSRMLKELLCTAYTQLDLGKSSGCLLWFEDLIDIRDLSQEGQEIYIRMAASEIGRYRGSNEEHSELPSFSYSAILKATNYFSDDNKLGEGGFGPVYKGGLEDGQEIAVKRLSSTSTQGIDEFKNEVIFIAKLQHRNLVRLLGCCIQGEENMLIYEYMPHKSLDVILFALPYYKWYCSGTSVPSSRFRLRIIHRDLKASNILLDSDMNPKISDFGTARSFGGNETSAKTRRVVGTYGYMSPEYAVDGLFSVKSDVFSFGVLVLEIVSGKRNRGFSDSDYHLNLLGHAWTLYKEERTLELVDASLGVLPPANQPGFFLEREVTAQSSTTTTTSTNELTITMPEGR
ncbi:UNVERIFIED_CONTAM: G-type lectin S-receptor-like serine/threonine-protein kinase [Sesamum calycinum]|uniref:non-specific serine/threonine protein kinase n=1 Tax=Sesamum calycinum TaxID=2727403 RepID=A0AAW2Q4K2_9LAMI